MDHEIIKISQLHKAYASKFKALDDINLNIKKGEIFALLGPNGAGKTTLISTICGIVRPTSGTITAAGLDVIKDYRRARSLIGLVPQELSTDMFEKVWDTVKFSRNLFGKPDDPKFIEKLLKDLSLWDKRNNKIMTLSGGMKRRVLIAKALSHEPEILFLDEPTAGVDVELRKDMWKMVHHLRERGVTIILTTHYIEEAEEMADRIGVINAGKIILVEEKSTLMKKLGNKKLVLTLQSPIEIVPGWMKEQNLLISADGTELTYTFDSTLQPHGISDLLKRLNDEHLTIKDLKTHETSLEEIFVKLVGRNP